MAKMAAIQAQLERASGRTTGAVSASAPAIEHPDVAGAPASYKAPSRAGKVHIGAYLSPGFKSSLRLVQAQTGHDMQALIAQALNDLFRAHNVPVIDHE
jgi:hypothetical protein